MTNKHLRFWAGLTGALLVLAGGSLFAQETQPPAQADPDQVLGTWSLEITAESQLFYLTVTLQRAEGMLTGTASEPSGYFTDVPLNDLSFDGSSLKFGFKSPTPPDGAERALEVELRLADDKTMEGTLQVPELNVSAQIKATKQ